MKTAPISGFMELLPSEQAKFEVMKRKILETFRLHGFLMIETPTIERSEILLAKSGGETDKQIYGVEPPRESASSFGQALRFDQTVPLSRYIVEHENSLGFPLRVMQCGKVFRGERAQHGRFREFYQCDIDILGREKLEAGYDSEIIAALVEAFRSFMQTEFQFRISNRKILSSLIKKLELEEKAEQIFRIIDRSEKVSAEKTEEKFRELEIPEEKFSVLMKFLELHGEREEVVAELSEIGGLSGVDELDKLMRELEEMGYKKEIVADMKIVRGLDYYTGTVFECNLVAFPETGSICSGGRYENLAGTFSQRRFPGVGGAIGLTRLFDILRENDLLVDEAGMNDYAILPLTEREFSFAEEVARLLRRENDSVEVDKSQKKLTDRLRRAARFAKNTIVIGEDEAIARTIKIRNMETGDETEMTIA